MATNKTAKNDGDVDAFVASIENEQRREDCQQLLEIMKATTGHEPAMWGASIVGFGEFSYQYESGRSGDWFVVGFSPRKQNLTLYFMRSFDGDPLLETLGKFTTGKSCLYAKRLEDLHTPTLKKMIRHTVKEAKSQPATSADKPAKLKKKTAKKKTAKKKTAVKKAKKKAKKK